ACFGPICRAPLAVMLMVAEMTGSITILVPALIAVGLAYLIVYHFGETIYRSQLASRSDRDEPDDGQHAPAAGHLPVAEFMGLAPVLCGRCDTVGDTLGALDRHKLPGAPV